MNARASIYGNIRRALGVNGREMPRRSAVEERLARCPHGIIPARGQLDAAGRLALFKAQAEAVGATVTCVAAAIAVPEEVARILRAQELPATLRLGLDRRIAAMPFAATELAIAIGPAEAGDANALSHAFAGVAETGTLVLTSGPDNPTTLNFLPDNHFVVILAEDIVSDYETVWKQLRAVYGKGQLPRTVNFITGPSRSADIEQEIILGAHGPRRLHIVVIG